MDQLDSVGTRRYISTMSTINCLNFLKLSSSDSNRFISEGLGKYTRSFWGEALSPSQFLLHVSCTCQLLELDTRSNAGSGSPHAGYPGFPPSPFGSFWGVYYWAITAGMYAPDGQVEKLLIIFPSKKFDAAGGMRRHPFPKKHFQEKRLKYIWL